MLNNVVFTTKGDWDSTMLTNNGQEVQANRIFVQFQQQIDRKGNRGEGEFTAIVRTQETPDEDTGVFPGTLTVDVPNHKIIIENTDPHFAFEQTRITYQDIDMTESVSEFYLEIDGVQNIVQCYITLWQGPIATDEPYETFTIL
jgi:hypothetical protein